MRVLFVSPYLPSRIRVRPFQWIQSLAACGCHVHLVALVPPEDRWASDEVLRGACQHIDRFELSRAHTLANAALAALTGAPLQAAYARHAGARARVSELAGSGEFDVVHVEHLRGVEMSGSVRHLPIVFDAVDSISLLFEQAAQLAPHRAQRLAARIDLARTRRFEARLPRRFARTLTTSSRERDAFIRLAGQAAADRIVTIPNGVDSAYFQPSGAAADRASVLFTGKMSYHANVAAALRLVRRIMPLVWTTRPDVSVTLAGKDPPADIQALTSDARVTVTGFVEDLRPCFARATVSAAPLVYGAGIQNKVLEAMASGVPVVTTPEVCGALTAEPDRDVLLARSDQAFAEQLLSVIGNQERRSSIGMAGRRYVEQHHDWRVLGRRLIGVYEDAVRYSRSISEM